MLPDVWYAGGRGFAALTPMSPSKYGVGAIRHRAMPHNFLRPRTCRMKHNKQSRESTVKPHPWRSAVAFLVEQGLAFTRGEAASIDALSKAKFRQNKPDTPDVYFLRMFGPSYPGSQIMARFTPSDNLFKRRCSFSIHARGLSETDFRLVLTGALAKSSFVEKETANVHAALFSDGNHEIEVFVHFRDESASVSIQKL